MSQSHAEGPAAQSDHVMQSERTAPSSTPASGDRGDAPASSSGRPKGADPEARRRHIVDVAAKLFAAEGFRGTSMSGIARAAGISQTGLTHYFANKDELLAEVMRNRDLVDAARVRVGRRRDARGWQAIQMYAEFAQFNVEQPDMVRLFASMSGEAVQHEHPAGNWLVEHHERVLGSLITSLEEAQYDGELRDGTPVEAIARSVVAVMDGLQLQWLTQEGYTGERMVADLSRFIEGLRRAWGR